MKANRYSEYQHWFVLVVVFIITAIGIVGFASAFPLLPLWSKDFSISHVRGGLLTGIWYLMCSLVSLPAGSASDRVELRKLLCAIWAIIIFGSVLMALALNFWSLFLGRMVFSAGMAAHMVAAPKLLGVWFAKRKALGFVMGLYSMSMTFGVYASLMILSRIGQSYGWHHAMAFVALLCTLSLVLVALLPKTTIVHHPKSVSGTKSWLGLSVATVVLALAYGGYNVATDAYLTISPEYLVTMGVGVAAASSIVGLYAWIALSLKPLFSPFLRKRNVAGYLIAASLVFFISVMELLKKDSLSIHLSVILFGTSMALAMPALFAMPPLLFGTGDSGKIFGLYQMTYGLGALALPTIGYTIDKTGRYVDGYGLICGLCGLALVGSLWLLFYPPKSKSAVIASTAE